MEAEEAEEAAEVGEEEAEEEEAEEGVVYCLWINQPMVPLIFFRFKQGLKLVSTQLVSSFILYELVTSLVNKPLFWL